MRNLFNHAAPPPSRVILVDPDDDPQTLEYRQVLIRTRDGREIYLDEKSLLSAPEDLNIDFEKLTRDDWESIKNTALIGVTYRGRIFYLDIDFLLWHQNRLAEPQLEELEV